MKVLLAVLLLGVSAGASVRLETALEPREATVGDPLVLQIKAACEPPGDCRLEIGPTVGPFEVIQVSTGPNQPNGSGVEKEFKITFTLFDVGVSTLPSLTVNCIEKSRTVSATTPEIPVTIKSVLTAESKDIRGLKGRLKKVMNRPVVFTLAALLAVIAGLIAWFKFRPGKKGRTPLPPPVAPHVRALEELRILEEEFTLPAKIFYSRLTDILRAYLEGAFRAPAMDRTTAEIFAELKSLSITTDQRLGLRAVLEDGDLAKFAKLEPTEEERLTDFQRVRDFVLATKPDEKNKMASLDNNLK